MDTPEVLEYCTQEILAKNAFHASLEAAKSVFDRLRQLTGEQLDGARLVDAVLMPGATGAPQVAINTGVTTTERDEQKGFASLIKGLGSMYRNPAAHDPRLSPAGGRRGTAGAADRLVNGPPPSRCRPYTALTVRGGLVVGRRSRSTAPGLCPVARARPVPVGDGEGRTRRARRRRPLVAELPWAGECS
ncbi:TIGR02391 family protein [Streptomyces sp. BBFR102]|uniref:TIGR02391 family protein n=1 Tax=Streptomyces sp. BBFR102 TaxID=3448171 RepID=UPI003F53D7F0